MRPSRTTPERLRTRLAIRAMVERLLRQGGARFAVRDEKAIPLDQGDADARSGLRYLRCPAGDVVRYVVRGQLDDAKPLRDRQGADGGDELLDGHGAEDAMCDGADASR